MVTVSSRAKTGRGETIDERLSMKSLTEQLGKV